MNYRRFQTDDILKFISKINNILQQNDEMIFINKTTFLKWIRRNQIVQIINRVEKYNNKKLKIKHECDQKFLIDRLNETC